MFRMTSFSPSKIKGTIELNERVTRLGRHTDVHGKVWDIHGIFTTKNGMYVTAVPYSCLHSYFTDTSGRSLSSFGFVQQTWEPYLIRVVE